MERNPNKPVNDKNHRTRKNKFYELVGQLLLMFLGHCEGYNGENVGSSSITGPKMSLWETRIDLVKKAIEKLQGPEFVRNRLESLCSSSVISKAGLDDRAPEDFLQAAEENLQGVSVENKQILEDTDQKHQALREKKMDHSVEDYSVAFSDDCFLDFLANMDGVPVQKYIVSKENAEALQEILNKYPETDQNFGLENQQFQATFMNSLSVIYTKITASNPGLKLENIDDMDVQVRDMERIGLQLGWLKERLAKIRERKRVVELEEIIKVRKAQTREAELELANLKKKPRQSP